MKDTVVVHIQTPHESFDEYVYVRVFLPNRPQVGEIIYLSVPDVEDLERQVNNCSPKHRDIYKEYEYQGSIFFGDAIYVKQIAHFSDEYGALHIELGS